MQSTDLFQSLSNYQWHFSQNQNKISQFIWEHKTPQITKAVLKKKDETGGIKLPDCVTLQSYSHQDSMVQAQKQKYRPMEQETNPCTYGYLIFDKGGKNIMGQRQPLQ